jgi:hypothetical protein
MNANPEVPMRRTLIPAAVAAAFLLGNWPGALQHPTRPGALIAPAAAQGYDDSAYQDFYDAMAPYGNWVVSARWGHVWYPNDVPRGWRPYTDGHWAFTDQYGWTWVSDQEWGWAPFHYGRWAFDQEYGWVWVPGRVWGPAWVSFRASDQYIGWAPLPPDSGYDYDNYEPPVQPGWWSFVRRDRFDSPRIAPQLVMVQQNVNIIHVTKNITNIKVVNNYGVNRSFDDRYVERYTHRPVEHYRPTVVSENDWHKGQRPPRNQVVVVQPPKEGRHLVQGSGENGGNLQDQRRRQQDQAGQQQDRRRQQEQLQQQQLQEQQAHQQQDRRRQQEQHQQQQLQEQQAHQQQDRRRQQEQLQQQQIQQEQARQQEQRRHQQQQFQQQQLQQQQQAHQQQDRQRQEAARQQQELRRQQNGNGNGNGHRQENAPPPKHGSCGQPGQGPC